MAKVDTIKKDRMPNRVKRNIAIFNKLSTAKRKKIINALLLHAEAMQLYEEASICALTLLWSALEGMAPTKARIRNPLRIYCSQHTQIKDAKYSCIECMSNWRRKKGKLYNVYRFLINNIDSKILKGHQQDLKKLLIYCYKNVRNPLVHEARIKKGKLGKYSDLNYLDETTHTEKTKKAFESLKNYFLLATSRWIEKQH